MFETIWLFIVWLIHNRVFQAAISGALIAAGIDYDTFRKWQRWQDFRDYDWGVASFRWFKGAVGGAVAALGWGLI